MAEAARGGAGPAGEMLALLKAAAAVRSPDRELAVRYTSNRARLLSGPLAGRAPGFLLQCVSVFKFHDFINLFAPDLASRTRFIEQAFRDMGQEGGAAPPDDIFGEDR